MHRARAADRAADLCTVERFVDNLANGASAPPALRAAAKTAIDMTCRPARCRTRRASHLLVAQYVAGTNNHQAPLSGYSLPGACNGVKIKLLFTNVLNCWPKSVFCGLEDPGTAEFFEPFA